MTQAKSSKIVFNMNPDPFMLDVLGKEFKDSLKKKPGPFILDDIGKTFKDSAQ